MEIEGREREVERHGDRGERGRQRDMEIEGGERGRDTLRSRVER